MCGISGLFDLQGAMAASELERTVRVMTDRLHHRGPDMGGRWVDPQAGIALGHRRLSIIDLSPDGQQPMLSASGRYVIVFNGEIYNYRDLAAPLRAAGTVFRGHSDTEVLLALIEQDGLSRALEQAAGMFALALWDRHERMLHLARDRMGKKPLYYGRVGGRIAFASELKAIMTLPDVPLSIDRGALTAYLRHQYVPGPRSILRGISKLPPGHLLSIDRNGEHAPAPFWSLAEQAEEAAPPIRSDAEALDAIEAVLQKAVRERMVADVPVGAFLSGGIDSSLIVAMMQRLSPEPVRTFTIGFEDQAFDESDSAADVAAAIGTRHKMIRLDAAATRAVIPSLAEIYDEPFADPSAVPMLHVARLAREEVTVCLSGDGGDELFAGYGRYSLAERLGRRIERTPLWLRNLLGGGIEAMPVGFWDRALQALPLSAGDELRGGMSGDRMRKLAALLSAQDRDALYRRMTSVHAAPEDLVLGGREPDDPPIPALSDPLRRMMYSDTVRYLPDDILVKVDRATMAVGLEARAPLLDHRLVELAWRLPGSFLRRDGRGKWPLRQLFTRYLPANLAERPKRGFSVPIADWLRGPLRDWAEELLAPAHLAEEGLLAPAPVRAMWDEHLSGRRNWSFQLWTLLMFQSWHAHWQAAVSAPQSRSAAA